jgi:hypothetical protein
LELGKELLKTVAACVTTGSMVYLACVYRFDQFLVWTMAQAPPHVADTATCWLCVSRSFLDLDLVKPFIMLLSAGALRNFKWPVRDGVGKRFVFR